MKDTILHLTIDSKITEQYLKFLSINFDIKKHEIIILNLNNKGYINLTKIEKNNIKIIKNRIELLKFYLTLYRLRKYKKIIVHGWYYPKFSLFLFFNQYLLKKIYWCLWGGDSRVILEEKDGIKKKIYKYIDGKVKMKSSYFITQFKEEVELLEQKYKVKCNWIDCFKYPGNSYKSLIVSEKNKTNKYNIQLGNSAEERNHLQILNRLEKKIDKIEKIFLPLAYGDSNNYKELLLKNIPENLEEKVVPILKIQEYSKYIEFLAKIDIGIFPFKRQQAFGNIISLLGMKKTIYLDENSITFKFLKRIGISTKLISNLDTLEVFEDTILEKNKEIIREKFSEKKLIEDWKKIFEI